MDIQPDLSHLTDDERHTIQSVIHRQRLEQAIDEDESSSLNDYSFPSMTISSRQHSLTNSSGIIHCQICHKAKSLRQCSICQKHICVSCGTRFKSQHYLCNQCRQKQEQYFSSKNIGKQYLSDYILSQTSDELTDVYGANQKRIPSNLQSNLMEEDMSSPEFVNNYEKSTRLLPEIKQNILRQFQYHSLEERDLGQEATLKDSGIDTASSSTILNIISADKLPQPMTYWRFNEDRTEQIGHIYMKNSFVHSNLTPMKRLRALGLQIQFHNQTYPEIAEVIPGSIADTYGQLKAGDQILEWNGDKCVNLHTISLQSSQIHLLVKRFIHSNRISQEDKIQPSTIENLPIQLNLSFQYDEKNLHIMIYGARNIPIQHGLLACQLVLQYERDILSTQEKCTKAQSCLAGQCTWNQHIIFFDIQTIDNLCLWMKLINLERNQEILGDIRFDHFKLNNIAEWHNLTHSTNNHVLPNIPSSSTSHNRRRQLPDIPPEKLQANREKVSQDLFQKATEIKLRLMQSRTDRSLVAQRSFDQSQITDYQPSRTSMSSLASSTVNLREKSRIPVIKERRTTMMGQQQFEVDKVKLNSMDEKYPKSMMKQQSLGTSVDEIDYDGSEISSISRKSLVADRSRNVRKQSVYIRQNELPTDPSNEVQLNEEELRQMEMRPYETVRPPPVLQATPVPTVPLPVETEVKPITSTGPSDKLSKIEQRTDGTVSDSGLSSQTDSSRKRTVSKQSKAFVILGLSKKANSSSSVGINKRSGFQRSEEIGVQPHLRNRALERQTSKENETPTSAPVAGSSSSPFNSSLQRDHCQSMPLDIRLWSGALKLPHEHQFTEFIEGLGKGQLVGRQVLASPCHGDIKIGLRDKNGLLEVEIIQAKNLTQQLFYKTPPALFVKIYLLDGKTCVEKQRTRATRHVLDPPIHQIVIFKEYYRDKILQVSVFGDYGKLDRNVFLGVCQIGLDEINLQSYRQQLVNWYKLFSANSLMNNYMIVQQSNKKLHDKI